MEFIFSFSYTAKVGKMLCTQFPSKPSWGTLFTPVLSVLHSHASIFDNTNGELFFFF